ncbi:sulfurtransferase complex subunit TusD [Zobellella denitrificans]|jgi:tRNA 2-thiouridine synthesizing protein D|uniref:Sulfur relay protein TusD n=1 Tax=Zobellella denitrificans TaxID=347534 RepID=A0A231MW61_9GAMM|nr:sulfurtransferase complex subunit TusD [Zobellella denitrificans]ATG72706.1 sulfur relay protein TusD [Zobellella denitrificans]OXS14417.1 sulfurtransferase complex subunit TusD [Zobellella denitrificans]
MNPSPLRFALLVTGPCYGTQSAADAYRFARALLQQGHVIDNVFFYQDGVHNGSLLIQPAGDEVDLHRAWVELAEEQGLALDLCVAAALRRGLSDQASSQQAGLAQWNVVAPFRLSGLGELAQASLSADRVVQF